MTLSLSVAFLRMLVAMVLGMILGLERSIAHKDAGMRTYALVSLGACLFVVTSLMVIYTLEGDFSIDPMRVATSIITGVGFIGAGVVFHTKDTLKGLTTAAGLWVSAGIGITVGFGFYYIAMYAVVLALLTFTLVWYIEQYVVNGKKRKK